MKPNPFKSFLSVSVLIGVALLPTRFSGAGDPPRKVVLCHKGSTLEVAEPAVQAHLNHGDTLGACEISPGQNR